MIYLGASGRRLAFSAVEQPQKPSLAIVVTWSRKSPNVLSIDVSIMNKGSDTSVYMCIIYV